MPTEILADERVLREARRSRVLDEMEARDIDVLFIGHEANARYVSGAQRLWIAGTRPYGPGCVVVRSRGSIHLVSTWDEGVPEDIAHENLFGITWNPGNLMKWLRGIEGVPEAKRIGTDSLTPRFAQMLPRVFPDAEIVDAEPALQAARRVKSPEEIDAIRASLVVAEKALAAAVAALRPGVSERHLAAVFMEEMARQGVTTPAHQRVVRRFHVSRPVSRNGSGVVAERDLVAFDAGVVAGGYSGEVGRTWPASSGAVDRATRILYQQCEELWNRLLSACTAGASCAGLLAAYETERQPPPPFPIATGLGLGFDLPVITSQLPKSAEEEHLVPGMVLALTAYVVDPNDRAVLRKDAVLVTAGSPDVLSSSPRWSS